PDGIAGKRIARVGRDTPRNFIAARGHFPIQRLATWDMAHQSVIRLLLKSDVGAPVSQSRRERMHTHLVGDSKIPAGRAIGIARERGGTDGQKSTGNKKGCQQGDRRRGDLPAAPATYVT